MEQHNAGKVYLEILAALWVTLFFPVEYKYLKYVTLGQFASRVWKFIYSSAIISGIILVCSFLWGMVPSVVDDSSFKSFMQAVPDFVWFIIGTAYMTWTLKGDVIEFPKLDRSQWVVLNVFLIVGVGIGELSEEYLGHINTWCVLVALGNAFVTYDSLIETGKSNFSPKEPTAQPASESL